MIFFKMSKYCLGVLISLLSIVVVSCGRSEFKIGGELGGASEEAVVLEKSGFNGEWIAIDSTRTDASGKFSIKAPAPDYPEIYRLAVGGSYIYVPVDSAVNIKLTANVKDISATFVLTGTESAEKMTKFERNLAKIMEMPADSLDSFKRNVFTQLIYPGKGDIMSYYILTRVINGQPLYNPESGSDAKYYAAVATAYKHYHPDDPRTPMLEKLALSARKNYNAARGIQNVVEAPAVSMIDMEFPNVDGKMIKLSDVVGKGKPTLVIFSMVAQQESPEVNRAIAALYSKYEQRINFYEVCLDPDIASWREAVKNLPWTAVIDYEGLQSRAALQYNVTTLPAFFMYNAAGELTSRVDTFQDLEKELTKF